MDTQTAWHNLARAIEDLQSSGGDHELKLETVMAGVELLFESPAGEVLAAVRRSHLPTRAIVSWLVFEGERLPGVEPSAVAALRELYEDTCPPGEGIIAAPAALRGGQSRGGAA